MNIKDEQKHETVEKVEVLTQKKQYDKPSLTKMGAMQRLTLDGSDAPNDSGTGLVQT